jgi:hypothetical protein
MMGKIILSQVFSSRVFLVFTGQQRLAKNTLVRALRRCALMPLRKHAVSFDRGVKQEHAGDRDRDGGRGRGEGEGGGAAADDTVCRLLEEAINAAREMSKFTELCISSANEPNATELLLLAANNAIDALAGTISDYWTLKREMACGSEPDHLRALRLSLLPYCLGWSLCGAGGGGFAVAILRRNVSALTFRDAVGQINAQWALARRRGKYSDGGGDGGGQCKVHSTSIDFDGLSVVGRASKSGSGEYEGGGGGDIKEPAIHNFFFL